MRSLPILAAISALLLPLAARAADPYMAAGKFTVSAANFDWHDTQRERDVPAKIYFPSNLPAGQTCPVIVFSHGLGGSRENYTYLGNHWASHGFVSIHLTHLGSDTSILKGNLDRPMQTLRRAAMNPDNMRNRPADVSFAIDQLADLNASDAHLKGILDIKSIGVAGHSFGGFTTMAIAGQDYVLLGKLADPRVTCAIAMSAPAPQFPRQIEKAYIKITIPMLLMTGTLDESPIGNTTAKDRLAPFAHMTNTDRYLLLLTGGDHMVFSGSRRLTTLVSPPATTTRPAATSRPTTLPGTAGDPAKDPRFHDLIKASTTAFWLANLKHDQPAQEYLANFQKTAGTDAEWSHKEKGK